ncbi:MAG: hypothetical protein KDJ65_12785 [Anaerolineae bacterium]|nr:hypothetical protein [Anaerolineae bacterium]
MTHVIFVSGESSPTVMQSPKNWQQIIWREWRNCNDAEYAEKLFNLIAGEPIDRWAIVPLVILGAFPTTLVSWFMALIFFWQMPFVTRLGLGLIIGGLVGGGSAYLFGRVLKAKGATWSHWLNGFVFDARLIDKNIPKFSENRIAFLRPRLTVAFALGSLVNIGQVLPGFDGQPITIFGYVWFLFIVGMILGQVFSLKSLFHFSYDCLVGFFFSQLVTYTVGTVFINFIPTYAIALFASGFLVGGISGSGLGRKVGAITILFWALLFRILIALLGFFVTPSLGWLSGFIMLGVAQGLTRMWPIYNHRVSFEAIYPHRYWMLWWAKRPYVTEVAAVLRHHATGMTWQLTMDQLYMELQKLRSPTVLIGYLRSDDWMGRFIAPHVLVRLGSEPVEALLELANKPNHLLNKTARWILASISHDTTTRLGDRADQLLCVDCLTYCDTYTEYVGKKSLTYHGCRTCGQSWEFILCTARHVIAVFDETWHEPYQENEGTVRVNYIARNQLFDFDTVAIHRASDEVIERFAVRVGNDTDPVRQPRYKQMTCSIAPHCQLSKNTVRVLERTFGEVVRGEVL